MNWQWLVWFLPLITAGIGWFTNYVAIKMLFHPRHPKRILIFTLHGVFPKRQALIAQKLGSLIAKELLSFADISERVVTDKNLQAINDRIQVRLHEYLFETFPERHPVASVFVSEKRRMHFADEILDEVSDKAPDLLEEYLHELEDHVDIERIVRDKVNALAPARLEDLMMSVLENEFRFIELVGFVIGLIVGLFQWAVWALVG